jgi:hypothetical protein
LVNVDESSVTDFSLQFNKEQFMKSRLFSSAILSLSVVLINTVLPEIVAANGFQKTGAHGGTVSATTTQKGNRVTGSATATIADGKTATTTAESGRAALDGASSGVFSM